MKHVSAMLRFAGVVLAASGVIIGAPAAGAEWPPPNTRDQRCIGVSPAAQAICRAFLAQDCDQGRARPACPVLRRVYFAKTGLAQFPFELIPGPIVFPPPPEPLELAQRAGSVVVYPRVLVTAARNTVVQLTNVGHTVAHARCFYLNAVPADPSQPPSASNPRLFLLTDFLVTLTADQPTRWTVSEGRAIHPNDPPGSYGAGDDVFAPAMPSPFTGELRCVQVDESGAPFGGNALAGSALLTGPDLDVAEYDAIPIAGVEVDGDRELRLDGLEYGTCPARVLLTQRAERPAQSGPAATLTVIPCTIDYDLQESPRTVVRIETVDELEQHAVGVLPLMHWNELRLADYPFFRSFVSSFKYARIEPVGASCLSGPNRGARCTSDDACPQSRCVVHPILGILEVRHPQPGGLSATAVQNLQVAGQLAGARIELPPEPAP